MLERGETIKMSDGTIKRMVFPSMKVFTINTTPEPLATPPGTPELGNDKQAEGIEFWNALNVDAQAVLFRHQLRNAKNRKGLMLEWNEYCAEARENRERSSGSKNPPAPPTSLPSSTIDVKQIIANKLRELELKRDRDRQEASEERASKRLKKDPA